mgnify:CR=1 FL=1
MPSYREEKIDVLSKNEILDLLGFSDAIGRWQISMSMLRDNFALGVGIVVPISVSPVEVVLANLKCVDNYNSINHFLSFV